MGEAMSSSGEFASMSEEEKPEQTPREMIAKLAAMSPEQFSAFMHWNFNRICKLPLPESRARSTRTQRNERA
jgi:hypothetical protein